MHKFILSLICLFFLSVHVFAQSGEYQLIWVDEFDMDEVNAANWSYETGGGGWGNKELQHYTNRPENSFIRDGKLVIRALLEEYEGNNFTSARLTSKGKFFTKYGKIEASIKLPKGKGTWPAFWMMPEKSEYGGWPRSGEIDIMEHIGSDPTMISFAVHTRNANGSTGNNWYKKIYPGSDVEDNFYTYAIVWEEDRIEFYFEDKKQVTFWNDLMGDFKSWPFDKEFFINLNLAIGGLMGGTVDANAFNSDVEMEIDYVRVYRKGGLSIGESENDDLKVSYNSTTQMISVEGLTDSAIISIYDLSGKKVLEGIIDNSVSAQSFKKGIYIVLIEQGEAKFSHKIII